MEPLTEIKEKWCAETNSKSDAIHNVKTDEWWCENCLSDWDFYKSTCSSTIRAVRLYEKNFEAVQVS